MFIIKAAVVLLTCLPLLSFADQQLADKVTPVPIIKETAIAAEPENRLIPPIWIDDPRLVNYITAVGSSGLQKWGGEQAQYIAAMQDAQLNLSIAFKKYQNALEHLKRKESVDQPENDIEQNIKIFLLENAIVQEEWKHPETERLYLWLIIPDF